MFLNPVNRGKLRWNHAVQIDWCDNGKKLQRPIFFYSPVAGIGGSLVPRTGAVSSPVQRHESLTVFSFSLFRCSNRWQVLSCFRKWGPATATPPADSGKFRASTKCKSSRVLRSPRLPPLFTAISTPLSLLGALPSGDGSLLHDD